MFCIIDLFVWNFILKYLGEEIFLYRVFDLRGVLRSREKNSVELSHIRIFSTWVCVIATTMSLTSFTDGFTIIPQ